VSQLCDKSGINKNTLYVVKYVEHKNEDGEKQNQCDPTPN
jgi:hypothetical protein